LLDCAEGSASFEKSAPKLPADAQPPPLIFDYAYSRRIACLADPPGPAAAAYRSLQTHLLAGHVRDGRRGLALCAPAPETGCTTVAVNLAIAFAQAGINTLLVDANLHRPSVHEFIRPSAPALGLAQMLTAHPDARTDEIRRNVRPNLSVLYAGGVPARAHDLIANRRFKQIIDDCMRAFEFTIVDTPALRGSTDARHIAMGVRYGLIIARRNVTLLSDIRSVVDELSNDRIRLVGSFLADF
jgi:Mrp family chromosome partitioning ATPase